MESSFKKVRIQGANERLRRRSETYAAQRSEVCNEVDGFFLASFNKESASLGDVKASAPGLIGRLTKEQ